MAIDLPANFQETAYGAPVVQVAQASSSAACQQTGTQRYKLGNTGDTLDITRNAEGKPTSFILTKAGSAPTELKVKIMVPTHQLIITTFTDKSSVTLFNMSSPDGRPLPSSYKDAQGRNHALTPVAAPSSGAEPQCALS